VKAGDIWLAQLDPTVGSEIQKTRPCIVISPDEMNAHLRTVIVAPMTTGSRPAAFRIPLTFQGKSGLILLDQIRTLDRIRLVKRLGALRPLTLATALNTLQAMFAPAAHDEPEDRLASLGGTEPALKAARRRRPPKP
jgi:mRNA interferase MazF